MHGQPFTCIPLLYGERVRTLDASVSHSHVRHIHAAALNRSSGAARRTGCQRPTLPITLGLHARFALGYLLQRPELSPRCRCLRSLPP